MLESDTVPACLSHAERGKAELPGFPPVASDRVSENEEGRVNAMIRSVQWL